MRSKTGRFLCVLLSVSFWTLLSTQTTAHASVGNFRLRVVQASPDSGPIDMYINGNRVFANKSYGSVSEYVPVQGGTLVNTDNLTVLISVASPDTLSPTVLLLTTTTVDDNSDNTLVVYGTQKDASKLQLLNFHDATSPFVAGYAQLRFINITASGPALDVTTPTAVLFSGGPGTNSNYRNVPAGTYPLTVSPTGTTNGVATLPDAHLLSGNIYTLFVFGPQASPSSQAYSATLVFDANPVPPATATPAPSPSAIATALSTATPKLPGLPNTGQGGAKAESDSLVLPLVFVVIVLLCSGWVVLCRRNRGEKPFPRN